MNTDHASPLPSCYADRTDPPNYAAALARHHAAGVTVRENLTSDIPDDPSPIADCDKVSAIIRATVGANIGGSREEWKGTDACLETSLLEYGMIWREADGVVRFIFTTPGWNCDENRVITDWAEYPLDTDVEKEWDWVFKEGADGCSIMNSIGITLEEFRPIPLPYKIAELVRYHGALEIFGESYYPTLTVFPEDTDD